MINLHVKKLFVLATVFFVYNSQAGDFGYCFETDFGSLEMGGSIGNNYEANFSFEPKDLQDNIVAEGITDFITGSTSVPVIKHVSKFIGDEGKKLNKSFHVAQSRAIETLKEETATSALNFTIDSITYPSKRVKNQEDKEEEKTIYQKYIEPVLTKTYESGITSLNNSFKKNASSITKRIVPTPREIEKNVIQNCTLLKNTLEENSFEEAWDEIGGREDVTEFDEAWDEIITEKKEIKSRI